VYDYTVGEEDEAQQRRSGKAQGGPGGAVLMCKGQVLLQQNSQLRLGVPACHVHALKFML
jgi:hypothetical protein